MLPPGFPGPLYLVFMRKVPPPGAAPLGEKVEKQQEGVRSGAQQGAAVGYLPALGFGFPFSAFLRV